MRIAFSRQHLKEAVGGLSKVVSRHSSLPVLHCVKIDTDGKTASLTVTDLDQSVRYTLPACEVTGAHSFLIDLQYLKDLTKGSDSDPIIIQSRNNDEATLEHSVRGQPILRPVPTLPSEEFPDLDFTLKTHSIPDLLAIYRQLAPFASQDTTRLPITGIAIDCSEKGEGKACMVATDGRRLTARNHLTVENIKTAIILPMSPFLTWSKLTGEAGLGVSKDERWVKVTTGPWEFVAKTIDADYPNWRQVIPYEPGPNVIALTDTDMDALKAVLPSLPGEAILLVNRKNKLEIRAHDSTTNKNSVLALSGGSTFTGDCREIGVNLRFWHEALEAGFREFRLTDERCPLVAQDGEGGTHVLMPMRLDSIQTPADDVEPQPDQTPSETPPAVPVEPVNTPEPVVVPAQPEGETVKDNPEPTALERLLAQFEAARAKIREANTALADLAGSIKDALREDKVRRTEVANVREMLGKVQALKV